MEIKNTFSLLDNKEVETKWDMCKFFGITPVFAVRWPGSYRKFVEEKGGFCYSFEKQMYPLVLKMFTSKLEKRLKLPIQAVNMLPSESALTFQRWIEDQEQRTNLLYSN